MNAASAGKRAAAKRLAASAAVTAAAVLVLAGCQNDIVQPPSPSSFWPCPAGSHWGTVKADKWGCARNGRAG